MHSQFLWRALPISAGSEGTQSLRHGIPWLLPGEECSKSREVAFIKVPEGTPLDDYGFSPPVVYTPKIPIYGD